MELTSQPGNSYHVEIALVRRDLVHEERFTPKFWPCGYRSLAKIVVVSERMAVVPVFESNVALRTIMSAEFCYIG